MNDDFRYMKFIYLHCGEETQHINQLPVGLLAQLVERYTGIAEVMGSNPVRSCIFFRSYFQQLVSVVFLAGRIS